MKLIPTTQGFVKAVAACVRCGHPLSRETKHHHLIFLASARVASNVHSAPLCYACLKPHAASAFEGDFVQIRSKNADGSLPFAEDLCPHCCVPNTLNESPCFTLLALPSEKYPQGLHKHDASKCVCPCCHGEGLMRHTPWLIEGHDTDIELHVFETKPGDHFSVRMHPGKEKHVLNPAHHKEAYLFDHPSHINDWGRIALTPEEHDANRAAHEENK